MNMPKSILFVLLCLFGLSHAAGWEGLAAIAVVTSAAMLAILYMIGMGFGINELMLTSKEEAYQLIVVIALIGGLIIMQTGGDAVLGVIGEGEGIQQTSLGMTSNMISSLGSVFSNLASAESSVAVEGSKSLACSILAVGHSISGCGGYSMVSPALSSVETTVGVAIAELSSIYKLMDIGIANSFALLLPIGILFRTFKLTRGAGGMIIAVAIALYFVLPISMISLYKIADQYKNSDDGKAYTGALPMIGVQECKAGQTADLSSSEEAMSNNLAGVLIPNIEASNSAKAISVLNQATVAMPFYLFPALIYGIITPAIALLITVASIRAVSSMAGAEVDVSALARVI